jgi:cytidine deaminase
MSSKSLNYSCTIEQTPAAELPQTDRDLLAAAHKAALQAYAPYSKFQVGAAARLANGQIVLGANQENMSYPQGMCGERIAVFTAGAQHPGVAIEAVAIVSPSPIANPNAFMPCGGCRQVLLESEQRQSGAIRLLLQARDEEVLISESAANLVPFAFDAQGLGS